MRERKVFLVFTFYFASFLVRLVSSVSNIKSENKNEMGINRPNMPDEMLLIGFPVTQRIFMSVRFFKNVCPTMEAVLTNTAGHPIGASTVASEPCFEYCFPLHMCSQQEVSPLGK